MAASIAGCLAALEIAVRMFSEEGTTLLVKDAVLGQRYRPGYRGTRWVDEANRYVPVRFNREGFRGPDCPIDRPAHIRRVAVLGDSFVAAVAVAEPDTLCHQLEGMLNAKGKTACWQVLNFGVSGYSTAQSLLAWRHVVRSFSPDLVVLCFYNGNDLADNSATLSTAHRPYFTVVEGRLVLQPMSTTRAWLSNWLAEHSQLYVWQKHRMRQARDWFRSVNRSLAPGFEIFDTRPGTAVADAWRVTEHMIDQLAREVHTAGAEFLLVSIPAHEQVFTDRWRELTELVGARASEFDPNVPEGRLERLAGESRFSFLSLRPHFADYATRARLYFDDRGHWNEAGNRLAAGAIADSIGRQPIARAAGSPR